MKHFRLPILLLLMIFAFQSCEEQTPAPEAELTAIKDDIDNPKSYYYTPKPKTIPSKAPKPVLCRYAFENNIGSIIWGYCGGTTPTVGGPAPQSVLDALWASNLTHNISDLYMLAPIHPNGRIPFSSFYSYYFPQINGHITAYYQKAYIPQLGYSLPVSSNYTQPVHVNKQAFIDSWYEWVSDMQSVAPTTFNYLINNKQVYYDLFNFFADYNLDYDESEGIYLQVPYGQYANNLDLRCVTSASQFLLTSAGLTLLQQYGSGSLTLAQFRSNLPNCN